MMFEGPLFNGKYFEKGLRGQGPNLSIAEFKKRRDEKLDRWINGTNKKFLAPNEVERLKLDLQEHYQWEDLRHHHLAFIAKVLSVEFNLRTSRNQKTWIKISPEDFETHTSLKCTPIRHSKRIYMENLQEKGGWHYNLLTFPKFGIDLLTDEEIIENLKVKLPDGRSFGEVFWPNVNFKNWDGTFKWQPHFSKKDSSNEPGMMQITKGYRMRQFTRPNQQKDAEDEHELETKIYSRDKRNHGKTKALHHDPINDSMENSKVRRNIADRTNSLRAKMPTRYVTEDTSYQLEEWTQVKPSRGRKKICPWPVVQKRKKWTGSKMLSPP